MILLIPILARLDLEGQRLRADRTLKPHACELFTSAAREIAPEVVAAIQDWQETTLRDHPNLECAIRHIDPSSLGDALEQARVTPAASLLRAWGAALTVAIAGPLLTELAMAVIVTAMQRLRDLADILECGFDVDEDVGPSRNAIPRPIRDLADGHTPGVTIHPAAYVEIAVDVCVAFGWDAVPTGDETHSLQNCEATVVEGVRAAALVYAWLYQQGRLDALAGAVNRRLATIRSRPENFADLLGGDQ